MKYKLVLIGRNNSLIDDFFAQMEAGLDMVTSSLRYEDLLRHVEIVKPAAVVYCLGLESTDDMNKMNSLKRRLERANVSLIVVGERKDVEEFEDIAPNVAALQIIKPYTAEEVQRKILQFVSSRGMTEKDMENLRDRFYQQELEKSRSASGGSGSSLMDELADLERELSMETDLHLEKTPPAPQAVQNTPAAFDLQEGALGEGSSDDEEVQGPKKHILIIDDDPLMLKIIKDHLHTRYDVGSAISGKVAYRFLEKRHTDLILLDYIMPEENGPAVLKHLRANPHTKDIPVVFLTGMQERGKIAEALALRPQGYLLKPVDKKQLIGMVKNIIG